MFKSKHSGWTWDLKRTPFGGGGGGGWTDPIGAISDALASIDPGPAIGDALASVDPGPAIADVGNAIDQNITQPVGGALASTDKFMTNLTPYGWALPAALVAAYFSGGGTLAAEGAAEAGGAAAGEAAAGEAAGAAAGAGAGEAGAAGAGDVFAGYSATGSAAGTAGSQLTASEIAALNAGGDTAAYGTTVEGASQAGNTAYSNALANGATSEEAHAAADAAAKTYIQTGYAGSSSVGNLTPGVSGQLGASSSTGAFGSLNPALPAVGSAGAGGGMSAALAPGTVLGTGAPGAGEIGVSYAAGSNGLPATDFFGNYIPSSSVGFGGVPNTVTGTGLTDALKTANQVRQGVGLANNVAKLLTPNSSMSQLLRQGAGSGLSNSLGKLAQGANPAGTALTAAVRGNQNPFAQEQYFQVSNQTPQNQVLSTLLKQG